MSGHASEKESLPPNLRAECQEVRLAVVMYGGVSLAIYMNGVAQEILRLVRATALEASPDPWRRNPAKRDPLGTETTYRRLGQILRRRGLADESASEDGPILTSFVVDVLSGTSAGGINAVFLAKAIAVGGDLDSLRKLWMEEADIALLVNDRGSLRGMPYLKEPSSPRSLLNGDRMYELLIQAFDAVDEGPQRLPPPVQQLDLYVTTTDLRGSPLPIQLLDEVVQERRYRNVFHFRYDPRLGIDHFQADGEKKIRNRFLAFAARATSAFPFAFEPMTVERAGGEGEPWKAFLRDQLIPAPKAASAPVEGRAFGDGGYLDNKPFSYAIAALALRTDDGPIPVDRKLVYVEPAPERAAAGSEEAPDALENVGLALVGIPRYETIREDLESLLGRNRLIQWLESIVDGMEIDVRMRYPERPTAPDRETFAGQDLEELIRMKGESYGAYQRLKVYSLTDEIAASFAAAFGFDGQGWEFEAIRALVKAWRDVHYVDYRRGRLEVATHNRFLVEFDIPFRIRRLWFLMRKAGELLRLGDTAERTLENSYIEWRPGPEDSAMFSDVVSRLQAVLGSAYRELVWLREVLRTGPLTNPLRDHAIRVEFDMKALEYIGRGPSVNARRGRAEKEYRRHERTIDSAIGEIRTIIDGATRAASERCKAALTPEPVYPVPDAHDAARRSLWYYYEFYELYDMILYPILHATGVERERDPVEVIRVSPLDARGLIDERMDPRRKLAGTAAGNFGAFLDRGWRRNDFMWGRLDGAERLIAAALPGEGNQDLRERMTRNAHREIVREELAREGQDEVCRLLARSVLAAKTASPNEVELRRLVEESNNGISHPALEAALRQMLSDDKLISFLGKKYEVDRNIDRSATLQVASRAAKVVGRMLEKIAEDRSGTEGRGRWIARLAEAFWGIVLVAVPGSFSNLFFQHTLKLLYIFEAVLALAGWVLGNEGVQRFGLLAFGATFALHVLTLIVEDWMRRKSGLWRTIMIGATTAIGATALFSLAYVFAPRFLPESTRTAGAWPLVAFLGLIVVIVMGRLWLSGPGSLLRRAAKGITGRARRSAP